MIPVLWVTTKPNAGERGAWDQGIVEELTAGPEWDHRETNFTGPASGIIFCGGENLPSFSIPGSFSEGAVVVIAGQHNVEGARDLAWMIRRLPWSLVIVTSDEEALFPVDLLPRDEKHVVWNQYHDRGMDRVIPIGAAPGTREGLAPFLDQPRSLSVAFAGQATHERRVELVDTIKAMATDVQRYGDIGWAATTGFREGLSQDRYLDMLARTRIAPCPSGPHSLDSFRLYEALEAGCLPVVELYTPHGYEDLWQPMFGADCPLPWVATWEDLPVMAERYSDLDLWEAKRDEVAEWWQSYRTRLAGEFFATVSRLSES